MSQTKKPTETKKRNARGQFVKGNKIGEETRFQKENAASCKYKEEYCDKLLEFFNTPDVEVQYKETLDKQGKVVARTPILLPPPYPTFELFAASIGVTTGTLLNWTKEHPRFADCYARAKEIQLGKLTSNAIRGLYNPIYAKFEAVNNHNQKDKQEVETNVTDVALDDKTRALIERVERRLHDSEKKE